MTATHVCINTVCRIGVVLHDEHALPSRAGANQSNLDACFHIDTEFAMS